MKFYQKRGFALVVLILAIIGSGVYGISKKPAALPEVSYYNWICDEAGLLDQETRQTIQDYNTAWNKQYYAVVAVAAVDDIRGWSSEDYARELGARWGLGANDMLLLLVKGGDWYVACGDDLADQMTDTQQTRLKTALDTPYYAGDYSQAAVDFFRQSDVVLAQTLGRSSTGGQSPAPGQRWQEPAGASGVSIAGVVLLIMCIIREFLGAGTFGGGILGPDLKGIQILPSQFPAGMLTLPVGGFLVLAALIAAMQWALARPKKDKEESK